IDRARAYEAERRSNQRLTLLAKAGELLAQSIEYDRTLETVAKVALPALGDYCFFDVISDEGVRRFVRAAPGVSEAGIEGLGERPLVRPGGPARLDASVDDATLRRLAARITDVAILRRLGLASVITVPLSARAARLGSLTLAFGPSGRRHTRA